MVDVKEQHICIKICFKLSKTGIETHMLTLIFRKGITGTAQPFYWSSKSKSGVTSGKKKKKEIILESLPRTKWKKMYDSRLFIKTKITL